MAYTPPAGDAIAFGWVGASSYTPPPGDAIHATWLTNVSGSFAGTVTLAGGFAGAHGVTGSAGGAVAVVGGFSGLHDLAAVACTVPITAAFAGTHGVSGTWGGSVAVHGAAAGAHGVAAGAAGQIALDGTFAGAVGVAGSFAATIPVGAAFAGIVYRYEAAGEVRDGGILVNRRVRAYARTSGDLLAQGDTVAGRFRLHCGFAPEEVMLLPIHLDAAAVDYAPPCVNRVLTTLAQDA